jgi:hypothetical protein
MQSFESRPGQVPLLYELAQRLASVERIDLGSGGKPKAGFWGLDQAVELEGVTRFDLASGYPWPFADDSIDELYSSHCIEHIVSGDVATYAFATASEQRSAVPTCWTMFHRRQDALCWVMDEAYRVARPGARFELRWPALIDERTGAFGRIAFLDPTHRRFIPLQQLAYFNRQGREALGVEGYGASDWLVIEQGQADLGIGYEYRVTLQKPAAEP